MTVVRSVEPRDAATWARMRCDLWPEASVAEHEEEIADFFKQKIAEPLAVLIAEDASGHAVGFAELSVRAFAEGCISGNVGYLEGWYVVPGARRHGVGRALLTAAEEWARARGCREFASDTQAENGVSVAAHLALGFADAGLVHCFHKDL